MDLQKRLIDYRNNKASELDSLQKEIFLKEVSNSTKEESEQIDTKDLEQRISDLKAVIKSLDEVLSGKNLQELK